MKGVQRLEKLERLRKAMSVGDISDDYLRDWFSNYGDIANSAQRIKDLEDKLNAPVFGGKPFPVITVEMMIEHSQAKAFEIGVLEAQLADMKRWRDEMDTQLVIHDIGTVDSEPDPKVAHVKLQEWSYHHGIYSITNGPTEADYRIGKWLSAALGDPKVCDEMKADINAWIEQHNFKPQEQSDPQETKI